MTNIFILILCSILFTSISCKKDDSKPDNKPKTCYTVKISFDWQFPTSDTFIYSDNMQIDSMITVGNNRIQGVKKFYYDGDKKLNRTESKTESGTNLITTYEYNSDNTVKSIRSILFAEDSTQIPSVEYFFYNASKQLTERRFWSEDFSGELAEQGKTIFTWNEQGNNIRREDYSKEDDEFILESTEEYEYDTKPYKLFAEGFVRTVKNRNNIVKIITKDASGNNTYTQLHEHIYTELDYISQTKVTFINPDYTSFMDIKYDFTCK